MLVLSLTRLNTHTLLVLKSIHWLKIEQRIQYKLISLTYKVLTASQPTHIHNLISLQTGNNTRSLMLSHLLVHLPPLPLRSQTAVFSMPRLISGINFHIHFVNQFHLFMLTSVHPSVLHFPHPSPLHSFTLNSKLTFLVNIFPHRSPTIEPWTDFLG